ncbi:MAG: hypothetical protein AAGJ46_12400 [Planctomycetota bacterium]
MKAILRNLIGSLLMVGLGAAGYLLWPTAVRMIWPPESARGRLESAGGEVPVAVPVEGASDAGNGPVGPGNIVLDNAVVALSRRPAIRVDVMQAGNVLSQRVETHGEYLQQGFGDDRRFRTVLQGRIGGAAVRLWQVCDGRFVFTDLAWAGNAAEGEPPRPERRSVTRVDLRRVRREVDPAIGANPAPGAAVPDAFATRSWLGVGGLAMLLGELGENFRFETPRQMTLRNQPVYTMIGHWRKDRLNALLTPEGPAAGPSPEPVPHPSRLPHHVLVAIGATDLFPRLVEYRGLDDPLSADGRTIGDRLHESRDPLMRIDLLRPRFDQMTSDNAFAPPTLDGVDFRDDTNRWIEGANQSAADPTPRVATSGDRPR